MLVHFGVSVCVENLDEFGVSLVHRGIDSRPGGE